MKISHSIVRIKKIESPTAPMEFDEVQLEKAAQLILDMEGVVTPVILRRTKPEKEAYTVIEGHFEYYAALKAMEIDSRKGKTINAYIVESEDEVLFYQQQIALFRQRQSVPTQDTLPKPPLEPEPVVTSTDINNEKAVINEEYHFATLEKTMNKLVAKNDALEKTISQLVKENGKAVNNEVDHFASLEKTVNKLVAKNEVLEKTINQLGRANENALTIEVIKGLIGEQFQDIGHQIKQEVGEQIQEFSNKIETLQSTLVVKTLKTEKPATPPQIPEKASTSEITLFEEANTFSTKQKFLNEVNTLPERELSMKLGRLLEMVGIKKNKTKVLTFFENERQKQSFTSIEEIIIRLKGKSTGLGQHKLGNLVKLWN